MGPYGLGGGALVEGWVVIWEGRFEGNVNHGENGGGLYASSFIVTNTDFISNAIEGWGGGASAGDATIYGGRFERNTSGGNGGGLSVNFAFVTGTHFISNTSNVINHDYDAGGGGLFIVIDGTVVHSRIENNQCLATGCNGGGILLWGQSRIANALFANNTADVDGAAVAIDGSGEHELLHLTIADSAINAQSAIAILRGTLHLTDTIITSHTIGISNTGGTVYEDYNLFSGNITNTVGVTSGGHSLVGDPMFVDPLNGNYHLRIGSPAIDHGVDAGVYTDLDGNPRPFGAGFDIGAYEFQAGIRYVATTGTDVSNNCLVEAAPCATVQHAIEVANAGERISIASGLYTQSATLDKPVSLTGVNSSTTIIHAVAGQRVLTVTGAAISNSVVISGLTFTGGTANQGSGIYSDAPLTVINSRFVSNTASNGGGLFASNAITLSNVNFISNTAYVDGGGAYTTDSIFVSNTQFAGNAAGLTTHGGGLFIIGAPETRISNTLFLRNFAGQGGGLYIVQATGPVNVTRSRFEANFGDPGAGFLVEQSPDVVMIEPEVISNVVRSGSNYGAGVSCWGTIHIIGGRFENNGGTHMYGGGLYANTAFLTDTQFISNSAVLGGGVFIANDAHIDNGRFERNTSTQYLGGAMAGNSFYLSGTVVTSNSAQSDGGGISAIGATTLNGVRLENNEAQGRGGGISFFSDEPLLITDSQIISNSAPVGGGIQYLGSGIGRAVNTLFMRNSAATGAALYLGPRVDSGPKVDLLHTTIADSAISPRSAIAVLSSTLHLTNTIITSHTIGISNTGGTVYEDYNLFSGNITNTVGVTNGGHSLIGDPRFVDPARYDYHLRLGSPAIDHGIDAGVYTDLDGHPRPIGSGFDIGAYEFQLIKRVYLPVILK